MTEAQKQHISELRNHGLGYTTIASRLGLTKDCVRSYCRTHGLTGKRSSTHIQQDLDENFCRTCGRLLEHTAGKRRKKFCSNRCRMDWWNTHSDQVNRKAYYQFICDACGASFSAYGNAKRRYCSHECYIKARFNKRNTSDETVV